MDACLKLKTKIVIAIIQNAAGKYLIAQRPYGKVQAGLWEFPGGKCEEGEALIDALVRELKEELNIEVGSDELEPYFHTETEGLSLDFYFGRIERELYPQSMEGQQWLWVSSLELYQYKFPKPSVSVVKQLQEL